MFFIGAAARAMKNMGLTDLMLVCPRHFPHDDAAARASGAEDILESAKVVDSLEEALRDCVYVAGASARSRTIGWPAMAPRECATKLLEESRNGPVAVVFGHGVVAAFLFDFDLVQIGQAADNRVAAAVCCHYGDI